MSVRTSIIILSYNTRSVTKDCIESIRKFTDDYELIVIDNASKDGSKEWLEQQPDVKLIANEYNLGFPCGCNQGLAVAQGEELLLLNSDTIATPFWLRNLRLALHSSDDVGAVSCVANSCANGQQINTTYTNAGEMLHFAEQFNAQSNPKRWSDWPHLVMFCFLMKREIYNMVGELDEMFTPGNFEDNDYSLRIWHTGHRLLLCCDTFIHHYGSVSFGSMSTHEEFENISQRYELILERNRSLFARKWDRYAVVTLMSYRTTVSDVLDYLCSIPKPPLDLRMAALSRGNHAFSLGRYKEAKREYESILKDNPNDSYALYNLSLVAKEMGNKRDAHRFFDKSGLTSKDLLLLL